MRSSSFYKSMVVMTEPEVVGLLEERRWFVFVIQSQRHQVSSVIIISITKNGAEHESRIDVFI